MVWVVRIFSAFRWLLAAVGLVAIVLAALLAVPISRPPELPSIRAGAVAVDQSGLPSLSYFQARDGTSLAYRLYPAADGNTQKIAIVIHGSAGHSTGMNEIAKRLAADNFMVVAPDIRGHGASGTRGDIGYLGQLDNDLQDLLAELRRRASRRKFLFARIFRGRRLCVARHRRQARLRLRPRRPAVAVLRVRCAFVAKRKGLGGMGERGYSPHRRAIDACGAFTFAAAKRCRSLRLR